MKKYSVLIGIILSIVLLLIAIVVYPGGSLVNKNSVGFNWTENFISNLFASTAINEADNPSKFWADTGMIFLAISFAIFFVQFSDKIPVKSAANMVKYLGAGGMVCTFLIVTPLHDMMVTIASTLFLVSIFYITVFIFKSKLHVFKILCTACLLIFYYTLYLYGSRNYTILPIMQKVTFVSTILLVLGLSYCTKKKDLEHIKTAKLKANI